MRRWPSKWKGLVTTPTVRMPLLRAACATIGAAPVPVPPPMPAVTKHHVGAMQVIDDLIDALFSGRAADFRLRAGAQTLGHGDTHLDDPFCLGHGQRLRVGVGNDEVDAFETRL